MKFSALITLFLSYHKMFHINNSTPAKPGRAASIYIYIYTILARLIINGDSALEIKYIAIKNQLFLFFFVAMML